LDLITKLIEANGELDRDLEMLQTEIRRADGRGTLKILPAGNVAGLHGKTACFIGFDEIHGYRNWDIFEALAPDPTRDTLQWITSYDSFYQAPGAPLFDLIKIGKDGTDPRMLFSWYSADYCTDTKWKDQEPEQRANPSWKSWPEGLGYLAQQK
jgi:hypothetical protein